MKTFLKFNPLRKTILMAGFIALALTAAWANEAPVMRIINTGMGKQFAVKVEGLAARAKFQITTPRGAVLVSENIKQSSYEGLYNLQALDPGDYVLVLKTELRELEQPIRVTERTIFCDPNELREWTLPVVQLNDQFLDLSFLNKTQGPVEVTLFNSSGTELHSETIEQALTIEKRFSLAQAPRGEYTVRVEANGRNWYRTVAY